MTTLPNAITTSTRNWLGRLLLLAVAVAGVVACEEPQEIGLSPTTPVGVLYTDTLTITRETILLDSVRSNDQSNLMVGRYTDPVFGRIQAKAFVQLTSFADFVVTDSLTKVAVTPDRIIYDSTFMYLNYDRFYYGDTTQTQEIQVYRLTDSLRNGRNYDISSSVPAESQPLTRFSFRPRPASTDSLSFRLTLPAAFGRELLTVANTDAGKAANTAQFRNKIGRGLLLSSQTSERAAIVSFSTGSGTFIVVYYHVQGEKSARQQAFLLNGKRFNQITADRSGTVLARLQKGNPLPAAATGGFTYTQPATGVATKLAFPTLKNLVTNGRVAINRADLVITPTTPDNQTLFTPLYVALGEIDERNQLRRVPVTGTGAAAVGGFPYLVPGSGPFDRTAGSFIQAQLPNRDLRTNAYTFELSGYFQSIFANVSPNTGLVLLTPGNQLFQQSQATGGLLDLSQVYLNDRIWRLILDGKASVKLIVFYTTSA